MLTETRLIDANALKTQFDDIPPFIGLTGGCVQQFIDKAPTVDAVDALECDEIVNKLECLLCHATGGQYSKACYSLENMERMVTDYIEECCEEAVAEEVVHGRSELIALIRDSTGCTYGGEYGDVTIEEEIDIDDSEIERIADYLVANGVVANVGQWVADKKDHCHCSQCNHVRNIRTQIGWNFCPNCGAKMDGDWNGSA